MPALAAMLALAFSLAVPQAAAPPPPAAASAATAPVEDPAVTTMARTIYGQMRAGKVDEALLTPDMNAALTPAVIAQGKPMLDQLGELKDLKLETSEPTKAGTHYRYLATFPTAQFHITLLITPAGKVGGYMLKP